MNSDLILLVRDRIGPVATFKRVIFVDRLPRTRTGKTLKAAMRQIANHEEWSIPATAQDPGVFEEVARALDGT